MNIKNILKRFKNFSTVAPSPAGSKISRNQFFDEFFDSILTNRNGFLLTQFISIPLLRLRAIPGN